MLLFGNDHGNLGARPNESAFIEIPLKEPIRVGEFRIQDLRRPVRAGSMGMSRRATFLEFTRRTRVHVGSWDAKTQRIKGVFEATGPHGSRIHGDFAAGPPPSR